MSDTQVEPVLDAAGNEWIQAEVLFVPVETAFEVLQDLHLRSTGEREGLSEAVRDLSPTEAFNHYEEANAALLAQISISDASFARDLINSVDAFGRSRNSIEGLEGVLATSALKMDTADVGGSIDIGGSIDKAAGLMRDFGVSASLGGGLGVTHAVDAGHQVSGNLGSQTLQNFAERAATEGVTALREGLGEGGGDAGGALTVFAGLLTMAVGALASAFVPPVGAALEAAGAAAVAHGIGQLQHPHHDGGHGAPFKITETHYEKTTTHPDGTVTTEKFSTHTTEGTAVQAHPKGKPHGGEDKIWDDAGGFDESGQPIPINPLAVLTCYVGEPQPDEDGRIPLDIMPSLGPLGEVLDPGGFTYYDSLVSSDAVQLTALETVVYDAVDGTPLQATIPWNADRGSSRTVGETKVVIGGGSTDFTVTLTEEQGQPGPLTVHRGTGAAEGALVAIDELPQVDRAIVSHAVEETQALIERTTNRTRH